MPDASRTSPQICKSDGLSLWQVSAGPWEMKPESPGRMNLSLYSCRDGPQAGRLPAAALCRGGGEGLTADQSLPFAAAPPALDKTCVPKTGKSGGSQPPRSLFYFPPSPKPTDFPVCVLGADEV